MQVPGKQASRGEYRMNGRRHSYFLLGTLQGCTPLLEVAEIPIMSRHPLELRFNEPLTAEDLNVLEGIFLAEGSTEKEVEVAKREAKGLGLFVRSLVGLDREASKTALSRFLQGQTLNANQIEFVNLIVNHLASRGFIELARFYESPFTDVHPFGLDGLFSDESTTALIAVLNSVRNNATGAWH